MTIHIYYRHTPSSRSNGKNRPSWFSHEICFENLLESIKNHLSTGKVKLNIIFDGTDKDAEEDFISIQLNKIKATSPELLNSINLHIITGGTQRKAWRACVEIIGKDTESKIKSGDLIYLLENDYLHMHGWVDEINDLSNQSIKWDYLSLYDHPDKYPNSCAHIDSNKNKNLLSHLYVTPHRHWRTTPSTCATYIISREVFLEDYKILKLGIYDFKLFRVLTSLKRRKLISPIPALSTHCMSELLSPINDWEMIAKNQHSSIVNTTPKN